MTKPSNTWLNPAKVSTRNDLITQLAIALGASHDPSHNFRSHRSFRPYTVCKHCGFVNPEAATLPCGHTVYEHVEAFLELLRGLTGEIEFEQYKRREENEIISYLLGDTPLGEPSPNVVYISEITILEWMKSMGLFW